MTDWRDPALGHLFEEIANISQANKQVANILLAMTSRLVAQDLRLAKLEGIPLKPTKPQPHHAQNQEN